MKKIAGRILSFIIVTLLSLPGYTQMRLINDYLNAPDDIYKISFYSASEGFIAYNHDGVGFTTDSGRTVTIKPFVNIDTNGYHHDYQGNDFDLSGFYVYGVYAKGPNSLFVYGFSANTSNAFIFYSADKGNSYKVVYYQYYDNENFGDMFFPGNGNIGYARTAEHILKTTDGGMNWFDINTYSTSYFNTLDVLDTNTLFLSNSFDELFKSTDGGGSWQKITAPTTSRLNNVHFISATKGWVNNYYTNNGGTNWALAPYQFSDLNAMKFINDSTGFVVGADYNIYKTTNSGFYWERIAKANYTSFEYPGFYKDITVIGNQLWFSMGTYLAINTNINAPTLPTAFFKTDTTNVSTTGNVKLQNYSRTGYTYKWLLNNVLIGTGYNAAYSRNNRTNPTDTITLIVSNGNKSDTATATQNFALPSISNFTPVTGNSGQTVTINGNNFTGTVSVSFGGTPAVSFTVVSSTVITAQPGNGSSGAVSVTTTLGTTSKAGFTYIPLTTLTSFYPNVVGPGDTLTLIGTNFLTNNCSAATNFGGALETISATETKMVCLVAYGDQGYKGKGVLVYDGVNMTTVYAPDTITFDATPIIYSVKPLTAKSGDVITITGKYLAPGGGGPIEPTVTFGGAPSGTVTASSFSKITAVVNNGASGNVAVTNFFNVTGTYPGFVYKNSICPNGNTSFTSYLAGNNYLWQVNNGTGFREILNNSTYSGATTQTLTITNAPSSLANNQYRCVVDGQATGIYFVGFTNTSISTSTWENISTWSCGTIPDANTDVVISSGTVTISSNAVCRSITVMPNAHILVNTGATLTVTH